MLELTKRLYLIVKRILKIIFNVHPDLSPEHQQQAHAEISSIPLTDTLSEYQQVASERGQIEGRRAYKLSLLERRGIPWIFRLKRLFIDIVRAIKPAHTLSIVKPLVN